jgi:SAM-dependent methyltransferase
MKYTLLITLFISTHTMIFADVDCEKHIAYLQENTPNLNEYVFHSRCKTGQMLEIQKASELKYGSNTKFLENVLKTASQMGIYEGTAVDLGSGTGVWTKHLLNTSSWHVHAVDLFQPSLAALKQSVTSDASANLTLHNSDFRSFTFPKKADLILANNSLCFVPREDLPAVLENIYENLNPGGIVAATFWGDKDIRGEDPTLSTFTVEEVRSFFKEKYNILSCCNSEEGIDRNLDNDLVSWQVIYAIVQKPKE